MALSVQSKECRKCRRVQPRSEFNAKPGMLDGLNSYCKSCGRELSRNRMRLRRADPIERERVRAEKDRHRFSKHGRAWKRECAQVENLKYGPAYRHLPFLWNKRLWRKCRDAWGWRCAYCGVPGKRLEQDHFIPATHPACPGTVPWNIVPACKGCNVRKSIRDPFDRPPTYATRFEAVVRYLWQHYAEHRRRVG